MTGRPCAECIGVGWSVWHFTIVFKTLSYRGCANMIFNSGCCFYKRLAHSD